ncbi:WD repeat-containing protein RUP2-like [Primulina eburnea]|uniref:WD repeat-containing protein RUP2-like n=1 Tax=Primulina eburnea TaxID=1245227 RepID=UPI003C6C68CC
MKNFSSHFPTQNPPSCSVSDTRQGEENEERSQQSLQDDDQEEEARCEWDFSLSTVISSFSSTVSDAIGVVEFDQSDTLLATGGIARKIRVYNVHNSILSPESREGGVRFLDHAAACDYYMCTPAKLSSLKWKPGSGSRVLGSGDYDGVVMEYDLERRVPIFERDEHGGRRVWGIDYSISEPIIGASVSDDGTMQMWDPRCDTGSCLASVQPNRAARNPVCSVEFNPFGEPLVTVGCTDRKIYGYDIRQTVDPVFVLDGHQKPVTYTRFLDSQTIVSSSIDGCLMMWNTKNLRLIRTYRGHVNYKRFVGLSVWRNGGLLSCGSENNHIFVYDKRWGNPIWVRGFDLVAPTDRSFVSGICWRQMGEDRCTLVAGGSNGVLQVIEGERKAW